ncbi:MAG: prepilin-type N-terminal cleavage/methylation domain-containing protein [Magnetococcales bacterium]|nr:prepilin-type N-terminal cleavage/methylation domain-containing protein [Magnetococcales bacterium]
MCFHHNKDSLPGDHPGKTLDHARQIGFTLLEMILVLLLIAILTGAGARAMAKGFDAYFTAKTISSLVDGGHLAISRMVVELQDSSCDTLSQPTGVDSLQFINSRGESMLFAPSPYGDDTLLMQIDGGPSKTLLQNVNNIEFSYPTNADKSGCLVTMKMTIFSTFNGEDVATLPISSAVYLYVGQGV